MSLTNQAILELFERVGGNMVQFHQQACHITGKALKAVNKISLYGKTKRVISEVKRLKKNNDKQLLIKYQRQVFKFPKSNTASQTTTTCTTNCMKKIEKLNKEVMFLKNRDTQINMSRINLKLKRQQVLINSLRQKLKNQNKHKPPQVGVNKMHKGIQCNTTKAALNEMKLELQDLYSQLDQNNNDTELGTDNEQITFRSSSHGRPYSDKLREVYYCFRSRNIGLEHIAPIIKSVLTLVDMDISISDLPSMSTAANLTSELGIVARKHLHEELAPLENLTLHRDATTKKGRHFVGVQFSTGDQTLTAGLREVCDGKADTYVQCTNEILQDVSCGTGSSIISKVTNFMTDRSATEHKANTILSKSIDADTNFFKCAVHPLLQFSDVCLKEISNLERKFSVDIDTSTKESSTYFLLKCISKLFYKDGTGDPKLAMTYIMENMNISKLPIMKLRGNRFNYIFFDAAGTYYMKEHIKTYLETSKSSLNYIQDDILKALSDDTVLAIVRALGLICKHFTEPYWQKAGGDVETAIGMSDIYNRMVEFLGIAIDHPDLLLSGNHIKLFVGPVTVAHVDTVSALLQPNNTDTTTKQVLKTLCISIKSKCQQLFKDFLPGGKYFEPAENVYKVSASCPPNNICVERLMAKLDSNISIAPKSNPNTIESTIMFKDNKTADWLQNKEETQKQQIITEARSDNKQFMSTVKDRKIKLFKDNLKVIQQRQILVKNKQQKQQQELQIAMQKYQIFGLLDTQDKLTTELQKHTTKKEKLEVLKNQFKICRQLFNIDSQHKHLLQLSSKGKSHSIEQLSNNLLLVLKQYTTATMCPSPSVPSLSQPDRLVGQYFSHTWTDDGEDKVWKGKVCSYSQDVFQVRYFDSSEEDETLYELTVEEMRNDMQLGFLNFDTDYSKK